MINDYLSNEERLGCIQAGALAFAGMLDAEEGPLPEVKEAGVFDTAARAGEAGKSILLLAALGAGIPIGVFSHVMGRRIAGKRLKEEELNEKIRLYQTAANEMATGLSGGEV